jgi:LuxR family maltose regulon positive regulatory protein
MGDGSATKHLLGEIDDILRHRRRLGVLVGEVEALRTSVEGATHVGRGKDMAPLTPAELRVLPYLQTHLTVAEIGERLFVSRNTASSQITSIYRKLGVSSRSDAVRAATAVGLLGG